MKALLAFIAGFILGGLATAAGFIVLILWDEQDTL